MVHWTYTNSLQLVLLLYQNTEHFQAFASVNVEENEKRIAYDVKIKLLHTTRWLFFFLLVLPEDEKVPYL